MHGLDDATIVPADSEAIYAVAGEPKALWLIPAAGHGEGTAVGRAPPRARPVATGEGTAGTVLGRPWLGTSGVEARRSAQPGPTSMPSPGENAAWRSAAWALP